MTGISAPASLPPRAVIHAPSQRSILLKRLAACLAGGFVLAMMVGSQEGSQADYFYGFKKSVLEPRIFVFLGVGVLMFFAITYWPTIVPYLTRPGFWPLLSGSLAVLAALELMHWYDPTGDGKFSSTANIVSQTKNISALASAFFAWLAWTQLIVVLIAGATSIMLRLRWLAYAVAAVAVAGALISYLAHQAVDNAGRPKVDHSLGYAGAIIGYLVIASAMLASATTATETAQSKEFVGRLLGFRPGLPLVIIGFVLTLLAFLQAAWFSPGDKNTDLAKTHDLFSGSGLSSIAFAYLSWLGWVLLLVCTVLGGAAAWLRSRTIGWVAAAAGTVGAILHAGDAV